jgi:hypothetical protein
LRLGSLRITWILLAVLATFVLFIHCLAEVGGEDDAIPRPVPTVAPVSTPSPTLAP